MAEKNSFFYKNSLKTSIDFHVNDLTFFVCKILNITIISHFGKKTTPQKTRKYIEPWIFHFPIVP
ncbi:hypothetical protein BLX87_09850 [Bacillus sp. VT-16-64]|nr:hypothetical protein BLX87_09850 [Bacillus sp. VT-16-64]